MPPQVLSSDSESDADVIQPKKTVTKKAASKPEDEVEEANGGDGENEEESDAADEYTVEAIMDHKFERDVLYFHVKWQDYPKKSDWTWEPEEHLQGGSDDILRAYYESIGGRPVQRSPKVSSRKRGRASTSAASVTPAKTAKKPRTSILSQTVDNAATTPDDADAKWKPPAGNWEDAIAAIDTIEKTERGLVCFVQWENGRKSQHDISVVYKKCPQRMLTFYEQHLVFKESGTL